MARVTLEVPEGVLAVPVRCAGGVGGCRPRVTSGVVRLTSDRRVGTNANMKRAIAHVVGFAALGALTSACIAPLLKPGDVMQLGLPYWVDVSPLVATLGLCVSFGAFLGALTGLACAFSSGRLAAVRCLLTITIPALLAMMLLYPPPHNKSEDLRHGLWSGHVLGAAVAIAMAVGLAYWGRRRMRRSMENGHP